MAPRLRRVSSMKEMENLIDDYITQGYEILNRGESTALLRKKSWGTAAGHVLWGALTCWTFGFGNLVYAAVAHYSAEEVMLKISAE